MNLSKTNLVLLAIVAILAASHFYDPWNDPVEPGEPLGLTDQANSDQPATPPGDRFTPPDNGRDDKPDTGPGTYIVQAVFKIDFPVEQDPRIPGPKGDDKAPMPMTKTLRQYFAGTPTPDSVSWSFPYLAEHFGITKEDITMIDFKAEKQKR